MAVRHISSPNTALAVLPPVLTTITSPGSANCSALWTIRLSPGLAFTVTARPLTARPVRPCTPESMKLNRPMASATVEEASPWNCLTISSLKRGGAGRMRNPSRGVVGMAAFFHSPADTDEGPIGFRLKQPDGRQCSYPCGRCGTWGGSSFSFLVRPLPLRHRPVCRSPRQSYRSSLPNPSLCRLQRRAREAF